jgi:hypothetical protein
LGAPTYKGPLRYVVKNVKASLVVDGTAYFFLIGLGFMTVETRLLHHMSLFLGHPLTTGM